MSGLMPPPPCPDNRHRVHVLRCLEQPLQRLPAIVCDQRCTQYGPLAKPGALFVLMEIALRQQQTADLGSKNCAGRSALPEKISYVQRVAPSSSARSQIGRASCRERV